MIKKWNRFLLIVKFKRDLVVVSMFNLVYRSKGNTDFGHTEIQKMLDQARDFNSRNNITGCLLYFRGMFLQYLEGEKDLVLNLFEKIKADPRHSQVILISQGNFDAREFGTWEMAYENLNGTNHQFAYLQLILSLFAENPKFEVSQNLTSKNFWSTVKELLDER